MYLDASVVTVAPGGLFEFIPVWLACWVMKFLVLVSRDWLSLW